MILELRDVCKDYTRGKNLVPVLKNVNLQVEQGTTLPLWALPALERPRS